MPSNGYGSASIEPTPAVDYPSQERRFNDSLGHVAPSLLNVYPDATRQREELNYLVVTIPAGTLIQVTPALSGVTVGQCSIKVPIASLRND